MTQTEILSENETRELYFFAEGRIFMLPRNWVKDFPDSEIDEERQSVYGYYGNDETLAFKDRESREYLVEEANAWMYLSTLENSREVNEAEARFLDPELFELLDAINSGAAK